MKLPKIGKIGRTAFCILLILAVALCFEARLFQWQILEGEAFAEDARNNLTNSIQIEATRGQILDRNGKVLVGNRTVYNIVYNALKMVRSERNATILKVVDLLEERGETWRDRLPIELNEDGEYQFIEGKEDEISILKGQEMLNMADYATADECIAELARTFGCEGFSKEDTRTVASVCYSMTRDGFSRQNPYYVIADDVSPGTVGVISQRSQEWIGVEPRIASERYYGESGTLAPHVLGFTGSISQEQYESAQENGTVYDYRDNPSGYKLTDVIGKSGIESAFETELRGTRGQETIYNGDTGEVRDTAVTLQPVEGNSVYLTLDSDLQRAANISLKKNIESNDLARNCTAGAAVVLDAKNFGVLACSTYPTYDISRYLSDDDYIRQLDSDEKKPQLNRALGGIYTPGSVFKPMVALSALQEGVIGADTTFYCNRHFDYYDMSLGCTSSEGDKNVYSALEESCNVFFCNVGLRLSIQKIDIYAEYFGLGQQTGVELNEASGILASPQEYWENYGQEWPEGVTAQAAIGQADNMFTPMQLASYCATIANGGKRLRTHFLDKIMDYSGKELVRGYEPEELSDADFSSDVLGVVREGMKMVATSGTAADVFENYPVSIACKTGTAETSPDDSTEPNISFIGYAPAEDPQIVVAVMLEYGNKGSYAKNVAKDILDQYFGFYTWDEDGNRYDSDGNMVDDKGEVLKTKEELEQEKAEKEREKAEQFLASALEGEDPDPAASTPTPEAGQTPVPEGGVSSVPQRDDIPTKPFTGEDDGKSSAPEPDASATPPPGPDPGGTGTSPYYSHSSSPSGG